MQAARPCSKETACGHDVYKVTLAMKIYTPVIDLVLGGLWQVVSGACAAETQLPSVMHGIPFATHERSTRVDGTRNKNGTNDGSRAVKHTHGDFW